MTHWLIDLETYSEADLKAVGALAYAMHPSTEVLCAAWVDLDGDWPRSRAEVQSWRPGRPPPVFAVDDTFESWNYFDALIWQHVLVPRYGWPATDTVAAWQDTMVRSYHANAPGSLDLAARRLVPPAERAAKDARGHALMMRLCRPAPPVQGSDNPKRHHTPAALDALEAYCRQDVVAEAACARRLPKLPPREQRVQTVDRIVNNRGVRIDRPLVERLMAVAELRRNRLRARLCRLTGGAADRETQAASLKWWCVERGLVLATETTVSREGRVGEKECFDKGSIAAYLRQQDLPPEVQEVLRLRLELNKSSLSKLEKMHAASAVDGRLHGSAQHYGATATGRWAGRFVQVQNLPRGVLDSERMQTYHDALDLIRTGDPADAEEALELFYGPGAMDVISSLIRPCFIPAPGHVLLVADWNAIEPRIAAWMADCRLMLDAFAQGEDLYVIAAALALGVDPSKISRKQRNLLGKPQVIGCGYGMGWKKLADTFNLDEQTARLCVDTFRTRLAPEVKTMWRGFEDAAKDAIRNPGKVFKAHFCAFRFDRDGSRHGMLRLRLPSGRVLFYREAHLHQDPDDCWDDGSLKPPRLRHTYFEEGRWVQDASTWGGTLLENADQATGADFLRDALVDAEDEGLRPVMHVHDELLCEVPEAHADRDLQRLVEIMGRPRPWAPGMPLAVAADARAYYVK